jgi:hypothetical protein
MSRLVWTLLLLLILAHHDFWWWDRYEPLLFGFVPIDLGWHVGISLGAGLVWWLAVRACWPRDVDVLDEAAPTSAKTRQERA